MGGETGILGIVMILVYFNHPGNINRKCILNVRIAPPPDHRLHTARRLPYYPATKCRQYPISSSL